MRRREYPTRIGRWVLRHPVWTAVILLVGLLNIATVEVGAHHRDDAPTWLTIVLVVFFVYAAVMTVAIPRVLHRSPRQVVEVCLAYAITPGTLGPPSGRWLGAPRVLGIVGALESVVLVIVALRLATRNEPVEIA